MRGNKGSLQIGSERAEQINPSTRPLGTERGKNRLFMILYLTPDIKKKQKQFLIGVN